jgi:hypothetical protein
MKSEHRHELKTNELERLATEWRRTSEDYVQHHKVQLAGVAVVLLLAVIAYFYWTASSSGVDSQGWRAMAKAGTAAQFGDIADKYAGKKLASWARLQEGESDLFSGIRLSFTDRASGLSDLKKAQENFDNLIRDKATPPEVLERALFGLAQCRESLPSDPKAPPSKIDDPAIAAYENLLKQFPDTVFKPIAEARIAALRTGKTQDFYAWFDKQNPKPVDREVPKDLIPPAPEPFSSGTTPGTTAPNSGAESKNGKPGAAASGKEARSGQPAKADSAHGPSKETTPRKDSTPSGAKAPSSTKAPSGGPAIPGS